MRRVACGALPGCRGRMGVLALHGLRDPGVAGQAEGAPRFPSQCGPRREVGGVALQAGLLLERLVDPRGRGFLHAGVAGQADLAPPLGKERPVRGAVGVVAREAVARSERGMDFGSRSGGFETVVACQAQLGGLGIQPDRPIGPALLVAGAAVLAHGGVQGLEQEALAGAAVRFVASQAVGLLEIRAQVLGPQGGLLQVVAGRAEGRRGGRREQPLGARGVWVVARGAFALLHGSVHLLKIVLAFVARVAEFRLRLFQELAAVRPVRVVAVEAGFLTPGGRVQELALHEVTVAAQAEALRGVLQEPCPIPAVWQVAGGTPALLDRSVEDLAVQGPPVARPAQLALALGQSSFWAQGVSLGGEFRF